MGRVGPQSPGTERWQEEQKIRRTPKELVDCRRAGESIPIQTPEIAPVLVPEDRCPDTHRMLRNCLWTEPKVAQAEVTCLVCQSGDQFQNEAKERNLQKKTLLLQGVKGLMVRPQPCLGLKKRHSSQDPVLRWKELLSGLLGQKG